MSRTRRRQSGIAAVAVTIGLVAMLAMAGLALDVGRLVLNKSRLQSTVDAAALSAAKVLDQTGSTAQASAAARAVFDTNAASHAELAAAMGGDALAITYSNTLNPFVSGSAPPNYVRVAATGFTIWSGFSRLVGVDDLGTAASAVAGPSAPIGVGSACDLAPLTVCADMSAGAANHWGYSGSNVTLLKIASGTGGAMGPGNFQLIELGQSGANQLRQNLAGSDFGCAGSNGTVTTKPGNNVGPTTQGLNTRFGEYQGPVNASDYPPDLVTTQPNPALSTNGTAIYLGTVPMNPMGGGGGTPVTSISQLSFSYDDYQAAVASQSYTHPNGRPERRLLIVPISNCSTMVNGHGTLPVVDYGCFFLLQRAEQSGSENYIYGEYIGRCSASGAPGPAPGTAGGTGVYKIVLHNDPASADS